MKQYNRIKGKYPDALLLFRVGDFYETFGEDAVKASNILDIILTKRGAGSASETELAGFPHHSINNYLPKLVKAGCRVAICDQLENPKLTNKIVKRGVTELITPGVSLHDDVLDQKKNNFLASVFFNKNWGVSFLDISTGEFFVAEGSAEEISQLFQSYEPSEILVAKPKKKVFEQAFGTHYPCFFIEDWVFEISTAKEKLKNHFKTNSLQGFGLQKYEVGISAAGAIMQYLTETQHDKIQHINKITPHRLGNYVWLDNFTQRNLELFYPNHPEGIALINIIDQTQTAMGARLLRKWIAFPLKEIKPIETRQNSVKELVTHESILGFIKEKLGHIVDLERVIAKIATEKISPRALNQLSFSLNIIEEIKENIIGGNTKYLKNQFKYIKSCKPLLKTLQKTIHPEAPVLISKGNVIADGFSKKLDHLRNLLYNSQSELDDMLERESDRTKIPSLKIAFNNVFGYYIEVRNTHKDKVPTEWIRKQTLVNAERYVTDELKKFETEIFQAEEQISILEQQLFEEFINFLKNNLELLKENATAIANLDVFYCFADMAIKNNYCCPSLKSDNFIDIKGARHPVIEKHLPVDSPYISNDLRLNSEDQQILMITGPNMSGKSALLRQTALISLLAQIGSFVPATKATLGLVDKIFTRVGASDNISMGASTFMVEMNETASILNNISRKSLVILDEIGRGTSTYDGVSIAWAIAQYLHEHPFKPRVLFATHYHELNEMNLTFKRIKNFNVSIKETKEDVLFLRKLLPGGSAHSFGIHVAKMAGIPQNVLKTAKEKLKILESTHGLDKKHLNKKGDPDLQLSFFNLDDPILEAIKEEIEDLDIDNLTPVEALMQLNNIKRKLSQKKD
ncbi:MAG: DNA mismatch repair protein MutS [Flavobacteriaceae bacterium]